MKLVAIKRTHDFHEGGGYALCEKVYIVDANETVGQLLTRTGFVTSVEGKTNISYVWDELALKTVEGESTC